MLVRKPRVLHFVNIKKPMCGMCYAHIALASELWKQISLEVSTHGRCNVGCIAKRSNYSAGAIIKNIFVSVHNSSISIENVK